MAYAPQKYLLTVEEFDRMGEAGIFTEDDRVELLDGEIYVMAPIGDEHSVGVRVLLNRLARLLGERAIVDAQNPMRLSDRSEPQPDILLLKPRADFYRSGKPRPEDVLLLVEVAESSLTYDRREQLPRSARAGVREVWIVNLVSGQIEVYRSPVGAEYTETVVYRRGHTVSPQAFPDIAIAVTDVVG